MEEIEQPSQDWKKIELKKLTFTVQIIAMALLPGDKGAVRPNVGAINPLQPGSDGYLLIQPESLRSLFPDLRAAVNQKHQLRLFFQGCLVPAAPFLLFRLKREGFSHCRAWVKKEGIYLLADS